MSSLIRVVLMVAVLPATLLAAPASNLHEVGVGRVDITPKHPVRLNGFGFRRTESEGVQQRIWAKALALGKTNPAVVLTVDNLGVSADITAELARRLEKHGVHRDRLAITATHTHTAPMVRGLCATIFSTPIPKEHQDHIEQYTRQFIDGLEKAALAALADRQPAHITWGIGRARFAINRRTAGGPVDHDLPLLAVRSPEGKLRALWVNYACHAVTLSHNKIGGDWPGHAQQAIEDDHPGSVALVSVGCGADSNPSSGVTGDKVEIASRQGQEIAREVKRLLTGYLAPVTGTLEVTSRTVNLPLDKLPTREEWQRRATRGGAVGYHAQMQLARLDRGEKLRASIDYRILTWAFGDSLAMVFLPGEVVVDYALRLKKELDGRRLWINAYSNDAPGYVPSERIRKEGGYEGGGAMVYYDIPTGYQAGLERPIIEAVRQPLLRQFRPTFNPEKTSGTLPLSPQQSAAELATKAGLTIDLVAAEPLVQSPVAIDFGPDGRLWVAEMADYPSGVQGTFQPGGRVVYLEDIDGDGIYDKRTLYVDKIPFPTGVTAWRDGVLICAAPDILFAEGKGPDGQARTVRKLFSGFGTENYQARVNSLVFGLDGWVHGSCGLFGGAITTPEGKVVKLGDRDFRIRPDDGTLEPATGRTQQGRVRDDWDNWFGCDNSNLARHLVLPDHYLRRNPHVAYPTPTAHVPDYPGWNTLFPRRSLQLFKLSGPSGRVTAACGLGVYRDDLLGSDFTGNLFTCEPVSLSVHRELLRPRGSSFLGSRAADEADREFLGSLDGWFRPVQARTGPDGALWIVDMYRFVIEHPRWIPPEELARVDTRAGASMGRLYRVRPANKPLRAVPRFNQLEPPALAALLASPNGIQRDLATQTLLWRGKAEAAAPVRKLLASARPEARVHALCVLDGLKQLTADDVLTALKDAHPGVRRHAVRLAERFLGEKEPLGDALVSLVDDPDAQVRLQVAFSLGEWKQPRAVEALARLAARPGDDPFLTAAVLSSIRPDTVGGVVARARQLGTPDGMLQKLQALAASVGDAASLAVIVEDVVDAARMKSPAARYLALAGVLDALERRRLTVPQADRVAATIAEARKSLQALSTPEADRVAALALLGREPAHRPGDARLLASLLVPQQSPAMQSAALVALSRFDDPAIASSLLAGWKSYSPALRGQVLDLLLGRAGWTKLLLDAMESGALAPGQVDAARRQRLATHRDERVRRAAERLLSSAGSGDRRKVLAEYAAATNLPGNADQGRALFAKHCAACHRLEGVGHDVGPDLAALANKTPQYLLGEILDPNRNLDSRYQQYVVTTQRGLSVSGLLAAETATSLTLRLQEGKTQTFLRTEVEDLVSSGKSLMPEGLEKDLGKPEMAHLLAYLGRQATPPKTFVGNAPVTIAPVQGAFRLAATQAEIRGGSICFEPEFGNIGHWHGQADHVTWSVEVLRPGNWDVWIDWSCDPGSAGNTFLVEGAKAPLRGTVASTGGWDRYQQRRIGQLALEAGKVRLSIRPGGPLRGALMDLRTVFLVEPGKKPPTREADKPLPTDAASLAKLILDDSAPAARRETATRDHPKWSADLLRLLAADLPADSREEYRRIPWIWRVAIAAGKRNDTDELRRILEVVLPAKGEPLRDWQAVVLGGGVINGISLVGKWPGERLDELLTGKEALRERWKRALDLSAAMADNLKVPTGTRYDALRMIALDAWDKRGSQLARYLVKGTHDELMMGAISGLSDVQSPKVADLLLSNLAHCNATNRKLALEALVRTEARALVLLDAFEANRLDRTWLTPDLRKKLRDHPSESVRTRASRVIP
ncbi:MAG: neutral/alkaline non-lysosomal ceramidase N-terminal domain-containing protein [Gemmataceae bacterium]